MILRLVPLGSGSFFPLYDIFYWDARGEAWYDHVSITEIK